jgi:hypothetical protein
VAFCVFGGILGFYADLRRGLEWALLDFGGLLGDPRGGVGEEGGHYVFLFVLLGVNCVHLMHMYNYWCCVSGLAI